MTSRSDAHHPGNGANLGFEQTLWAAADKLRGQIDAGDYKHVVLGLVFLKFISDTDEGRRMGLAPSLGTFREGSSSVEEQAGFRVPEDARWSRLQEQSKARSIGRILDAAIARIEEANPSLHGTLAKDFSRLAIDNRRLGELIELIGTIPFVHHENHSRDILGRVYEYFLGEFARAAGSKAGEFYTPRCVVRLLVEMLEPFKGTIYDPCCGSGGMFVQSEEFIAQHGGNPTDVRIFGQESNLTTWRLARMNLALRGIPADLGETPADTFQKDLHPKLRASHILANPPFNLGDWAPAGFESDPRWAHGVPPTGNANFAWVQHIVYHLAERGVAGFVLSNGSLSSRGDVEFQIRQNLVKNDLLECIVSLPGRLFYGTQISASLWFIGKGRKPEMTPSRATQVLFIDARHLGHLVDRTHLELSDEEITTISNLYRSWTGREGQSKYSDVPGFARSVTLSEVASHRWALVPGRYVGFEADRTPGVDWAGFAREIEAASSRLREVESAVGSAHESLTRFRNG